MRISTHHRARCRHTYITQLYIMSIQPVNKAVEHLINSTPLLEREKKKKKKKSSQCSSHNRKGEGGKWVGGGGHSHKQSEGLAGVPWVYKIGLKWPVIAMAITRKPQSVFLSLAVLCHNPSYVTSSRCARSLRLKELSDWQDLIVRCRLFHRKAPEKDILALNMSILGLGKLSW